MTEKQKELLEIADRADDLRLDYEAGDFELYDNYDVSIVTCALQAYANILRGYAENPNARDTFELVAEDVE